MVASLQSCVCCCVSSSLYLWVLKWCESLLRDHERSTFHNCDTRGEREKSDPARVGYFLPPQTIRPGPSCAGQRAQCVSQDVAWSRLIWTVLVFNCLHKTDGCRVTYGSISQIWTENWGRRQMGEAERQTGVQQVVRWAGERADWPVKTWPVRSSSCKTPNSVSADRKDGERGRLHRTETYFYKNTTQNRVYSCEEHHTDFTCFYQFPYKRLETECLRLQITD